MIDRVTKALDQGGDSGTIFWIWADDQLPRIGSGQRHVLAKWHPRKRGVVKVYDKGGDSYPHIMPVAKLANMVMDD